MSFKRVEYEMKVVSITKVTTDKVDGEDILYKLSAKDAIGNTFGINSPDQFTGIGPGSRITLTMSQSQKSMDDYKEGEEAKT